MKKEKFPKQDERSLNDQVLLFEMTQDENIVKAISYYEGKKQETLTYVLTEEQFEALLPESAR